ncbi:MAG: hypothetical protein K2O58_07195 [Bacteroidales bacterium]|nr:hypothetical protein [Bacteroidales bacterium]
MMENSGKDILANAKELKQMPYSTPAGYFENFAVDLRKTERQKHGSKVCLEMPVFRKLSPYLAMAAMFAVIAAAGTALMRSILPQDDLQEDGSMAYIDLIPVTEPDALYYSYNYEFDEISDDDLIEYLIYDGTDLELFNNE